MRRLVLLFTAAFCAMGQESRIPGQIESDHRVIVLNSIHPKVQAALDQGAREGAEKIGYATLVLQPSATQQAELETLLEQLNNRTSAHFRQWLTPEQFGDRFGLNTADYAKAATWLESHGLHIENRARARNWIAFSGTVEQIENTFHTKFHRYFLNGETHFANATQLAIPAALSGLVAGVRGLNDFDLGTPQYTTATGTNALAPDDWATIYDVAPLYKMGIDGTGQRIAIIGRSDLTPSDIAQFRSTFGLPATTVEQHLIGPDPGFTDAAGEAGLDVEWSGAVARNATIVYVYANNFNDAAQAAVDQRLAPVMSESFGSCEPQSAAGLRGIAQQANAEGMTFIASSGDSGPAACDPHGTFGSTGGLPASGGLAAGIPAAFPEVTAVGGTQFNEGSGTYWAKTNSPTGESALSYIPEMVWNQAGADGLLTSGGGPSIYFPKPAWQVAAGVPNDGARDVPDIAMAASGAGHDAYLVIRSGSQVGTGGTSAAAPSFAGTVVLLNQYLLARGQIAQAGLGNINPELYRLAAKAPQAFHDITVGSNVVSCVMGSPNCATGSYGYNAAPGYDLATGLGSVDVFNLVTAWNAVVAPTSTTLSATPGSIALGGTVQLTATVSAGAGVPTGSVAFNAGSTVLGIAPLIAVGNAAFATLTVTGPQLAAGTAMATATYDGDASFNGSAGSTAIAVSAQVTGSSVRVSITPSAVHQGEGVLVRLTEEAGVSTTVTGWTINGLNDFSLFATDFGTTSLPAFGSLFTSINTVSAVAFPTNRVYVFTGMDANGKQWTAQATVTLLGPQSTPELTLTSLPSTVPQTSGSCPWQHRLVVQEQDGFAVQLISLIVGGADESNQIQQLFGTTSLAPFGMLQASLCENTAGTESYTISGIDQTGSPVSATATTTLAGPASSTAALSAAPQSVALSAAAGASATEIVTIAGQGFTSLILPANQTTAWLKVATSGQQVTLTASAASLSPGAYSAILVVQTAGQYVEIPVVFTVGAAASVSIAGVGNGASFAQSFAPGMILSVFGNGLSGATQAASSLPLPQTMAGVSATVNGVAAPLYYVSPGQVNLQVPYETGAGNAVVGIVNNGQAAAFVFQVAPAAPGIFGDTARNLVPFASGKVGDTLTLFVTGEGVAAPTVATGASPFVGTPLFLLPHPALPFSVTVGGIPAALTFTGVPAGIAGATQVNFVVPSGVGLGAQPVVVTVGSATSAAATLTITP